MYIVTRTDLSAGMQLAQVAHVAIEHAAEYEVDDTVIVLTVPDEVSLCRLALNSVYRGYETTWFEEPDLDGAITAIAIHAAAKSLLKKLPLAGA